MTCTHAPRTPSDVYALQFRIYPHSADRTAMDLTLTCPHCGQEVAFEAPAQLSDVGRKVTLMIAPPSADTRYRN